MCSLEGCTLNKLENDSYCILHSSNKYKDETDFFESFYTELFNQISHEIKYNEFTLYLKGTQNSNHLLIQKIINNKTFILKNIHFPITNNKTYFSRMKAIQFNDCYFYDDFVNFFSVEIFFLNCHFPNGLNIESDNKKIHGMESIFDNCFFSKEVLFEDHKNIEQNSPLFKYCHFDIIKAKNINFNQKIFNYNDRKGEEEPFRSMNKLELINCKIKEAFKLDICNELIRGNLEQNKIELDFENTEFINKVKIINCNIEKANFCNTKFGDLADFYQAKFRKVNFERTDFEKISVFSEVEFDCDVDFKYTKFLGKAIFRDTVISKKLNLRNTIFDDEANFLDITSKVRDKNDCNEFIGEPKDIKVANRETARVIKNFYDNSNNVIEANRFYKLEMEERRKEFNDIKEKNDNYLFELVVFLSIDILPIIHRVGRCPYFGLLFSVFYIQHMII